MSPKSTRYLHKRLALEIYEKLEALSSGFWHKLDDKHRKMVTLVKRKQLKLITNGHRECYSDGGFLFFSSFCYSVDAADSPSVHLEWFDLIIRSWMRRVKRWNGPPWRRSESRRAMLRLELAVKLQPLLQLTVMRSLLSNLIHNFRCLNQLVILKTFRYPIDYVCFDHGIFLGWFRVGFYGCETMAWSLLQRIPSPSGENLEGTCEFQTSPTMGFFQPSTPCAGVELPSAVAPYESYRPTSL